ncbi:hypothetical protein F4803DRAFT_520807 [Xylaria telfairii]|nr:hypothetical protein F4803DRAFT_520807 [Xylaria telfairii]
MEQQSKSNIYRAELRSKCRKMLAEHIEAKLGLRIDPSQVRLSTSIDDGYTWKTLPETKYLFSKNLSRHSIRAYRTLCSNVGVTFEAVRSAPEAPIHSRESSFVLTPFEPTSFTSQITQLQAQNNHLSRQFQATKLQLEAEIKLRLSFDEKLQLAYKRSECLQKELQAATWAEAHFRRMIKGYSNGFSKLEEVLIQLQGIESMTDLCESNRSLNAISGDVMIESASLE